ncbi:MAG: ComF family protein [Alphaproteobacteria bacterium]|nr:ComF family protein [Alphaproteobacteria bacterium]
MTERFSVRPVFQSLLDFLLPPLCLNCHEEVGGHQSLCPACWKAVQFISPPCCSCCGAPFDVPVEEGTLCGECLAFPPVYNRARSAMIYDDASKRLVLSLKHGDRLHPVPAMAAWMQRAAEAFWPAADVIVPVPLHRWRLFARRYNQAALLAGTLGRIVKKPLGVDALTRVRATPSQGRMNREQRKKNMAGAIKLNPRYTGKIKGKNIVLVDDVLTTGATVNECARVLLAGGASSVDVLTLMRTRGGLR